MNPPSEHDHGLQVRSGRPLFYAPLIQNLKLKKTYSHIDVVNFGEKRGLFKKEPLKGKGTVNYARQAMLSFSKRNLGTPDNIRPVSEKKPRTNGTAGAGNEPYRLPISRRRSGWKSKTWRRVTATAKCYGTRFPISGP